MNTPIIVLIANSFAILLGIYVVYQQFIRLRNIKDDLRWLRFLLLTGTLLIIISAVTSMLFQFCRLSPVCAGKFLDTASYVNVFARVIAVTMLAIMYYKDGQCISGKK